MRLAALPEEHRAAMLAGYTDPQIEALRYDWEFWARPEQLPPPGDWHTWLVLAGRGFGKTRTGAETVKRWVYEGVGSKRDSEILLVGPTAAAARDLMIEGSSGLLSVFPPWHKPAYEPSKRRVTFHTGAVAAIRTADKPDDVRGVNWERAWLDELAAWRYASSLDVLLPAGRIGRPQMVVTTTPKRNRLTREVMALPRTVITRGRMRDNPHLSRAAVEMLEARYAGSWLGRQELDGEVIDEAPGALWRSEEIATHRIRHAPDLVRIVVAVDPTVRLDEGGDECGIVVVGLGVDGCAYVLDDRSGYYSARDWPAIVVRAMKSNRADYVVAEANQGGGLVQTTLEAAAAAHGKASLPVKLVHATRGKVTRAEPVAQLARQGRVRHVGVHDTLEAQLTTWEPGHESPGRLDALVWGVTDLIPGIGDPIETTPRPVRRDAGMSALAGLAGLRR